MLSYEEELAISDDLVARRQVRDTLKEEDRDPTESEQEILKTGDESAAVLVEAYLPKIHSIAAATLKRSNNAAISSINHDELVQEGSVAALKTTNAFNARGKGNHPGVRFGTYCNQAVSKAMNRYIAKVSTPLRIDVTVIQESWVWLAAKEDLRSELGREPSVEEIEQRSNIDADYIKEDLPHRSSFLDIDHPDMLEVGDPRRQVIQLVRDYNDNAERLTQVLSKVFAPELVKQMISYFGLDRMYPRMYDDLADDLGVSKKEARTIINVIESVLIHPKYRVQLKNAIQELQTELELGAKV